LKSLRQKKQPVAGEGSNAAYSKYYDSLNINNDATLDSSSSDKPEESANETNDADESDMDVSDDNPDRDNDIVGYEVFMHNKSTATPNSTYLSSTVISSSLDFIQTLLDETPTNKLMDFISHLVYTDAQTTSLVHNPKGNSGITSYISGASQVPLDTHDEISMDFLTGLPRTQRRHDAIWVVVDRLTKSAHFLPIRKDYSVSRLAEIFQQEILRLHGTPSSIVSDRDPRFTSRFWKGLQKAW
nr:retrotransposable element Tf2 [Tanacetum cinerariifolium]